VKRRIRLRGVNGSFEGKLWEGINLIRAGRLETLEIVLDDHSVSRRHAEVRATDKGWFVRDLGSTNGTFLNGMRLGGTERRIRSRDLLQCGKITLMVDLLDETDETEHTSNEEMMVEASTCMSWEDALSGLAFDTNRCPRPGEQLAALLRAGHHLCHLENEDDLLHSILNDAVSTLDAQRGAIVLTDSKTGELKLRAVATGRSERMGRTTFSQKLANRAFTHGESILYTSVGDDPELATAQSIHEGAMASVLCVLLRTPRKRLGVLHLDRSYFQKPFSSEDLHLADALAASVSAGIESAQLLRKERDTFLNIITCLAQAVEFKDEYTGGHTMRVTSYAHMLGQQLNLSASDLHLIRVGTPLHDIGKIGIDEAILRKPGKLTPDEFKIMQSHTVKGAALLATIPDLAPVIPIARSHHEKWDGTGYPDGLAGEAIPQLARIVAVADAFDAMTTNRSYRRGMAPEAAFAEVERLAGVQFDPDAASAFLAMRDRVIEELGNSSATDVEKVEAVPAASTPPVGSESIAVG